MTKFSIIIPLYNKENEMRRTIKSVLAQSYGDFELLIVNDGSTDNSVEIVNEFNDTRIKLLNQANRGVSSARNYGIKSSKHEYIALLDADDFWGKDYLLKLRKIQKKVAYSCIAMLGVKKKHGNLQCPI